MICSLEKNSIIIDSLDGSMVLDNLITKIHAEIPYGSRICVAMSGGVDSSVCAAVFKVAGYEVEGVTLKLYESRVERDGACCSFRDIADAKRIAQQFNFPHYVLDYKEKFREEVIDSFISDYYSGRTPIPCIKCNQVIKFNYLFQLVKDLNFDYLITGHYILKCGDSLHMAFDKTKDQSYYLYNITGDQLKNLYFPLGSLKKSETRAIANHLKINNSNKPDSQDICFVEDGSYKNFLEKMGPNKEIKNDDPNVLQDKKEIIDFSGDIIDINGKKLGVHLGIQNFTIGQRRGIGVQSENPLYVIKIDSETKSVTVGCKEDLRKNVIKFNELTWINLSKIYDGMKVSVRVRSMQKNIDAILYYKNSESGKEECIAECIAKLSESQYFVAPGQACVVYNGEELLGGGTIVEGYFEE